MKLLLLALASLCLFARAEAQIGMTKEETSKVLGSIPTMKGDRASYQVKGGNGKDGGINVVVDFRDGKVSWIAYLAKKDTLVAAEDSLMKRNDPEGMGWKESVVTLHGGNCTVFTRGDGKAVGAISYKGSGGENEDKMDTISFGATLDDL